MIISMVRRGTHVRVKFGSTRVKWFTRVVPCCIWKVVEDDDGKVHYLEMRRITERTRPDRRIEAITDAARQAGKGWRPDAKDQWIEVRPDNWHPGDEGAPAPAPEVRASLKATQSRRSKR